MLDNYQINKIVKFARSHKSISAIYLFGSHVSGYERATSDIDLGILYHGDKSGFKRINMETEIANILNKEVDLVDMKKCGLFLRHQIYKDGKLIYHDKTEIPYLFRAKSINEYLDTNYYQRLSRVHLNG